MLFYSIKRTKEGTNVVVTEKDNTQDTVPMGKFEYSNIQDMRKSIYDSNYKQFIHNRDKYNHLITFTRNSESIKKPGSWESLTSVIVL